jgi:WD40-like Beta Propeller Repeat
MRWMVFGLMAIMVCGNALSQEVYLLNITLLGDEMEVYRHQNISNNPGYDNQPSFSPNGKRLYFSSARQGQTDIRSFALADSQYRWVTATKGSEYSPLPMPDSGWLSAIKLDENGLQRLWKFHESGNDSSLIHSDLKIGYHVWLTPQKLVAFVLDSDTTQSLRLVDLATGGDTVVCTKPGRSIHRIPGQQAFSFVDKSDSVHWRIKRYDLQTNTTRILTTTLKGSEDYCWTPAGNLLMGQGSRVFIYRFGADTNWEVAAELADFGLQGISRMAMHPLGQYLAVVAKGQ